MIININNVKFDKPLQLLEFQATSRCNMNCFFCGDSIKNSEDLTLDLVKKVVEEVNPIGISLTGGEPLLNSNLLEIVKWCSDFGAITQINTNGLLLTDKVVQDFESAGLNLWHLSCHYSNAIRARHYQGMKEDDYHNIGNIIEWIADRKTVDICVETTLNITNLYDLTSIHEWCYNIGVSVHEIVPVMPSGRIKGNKFTIPLDMLYRTLDELLANKKDIFVKVGCMPLPECKYPDLWKYNGHNKVNFGDCKEGRSRLHIHNNGKIFICDQVFPMSETPIGDAKTDSIWDIYYNNPIIKAWREKPTFCCEKYPDSCQNICQGTEFDPITLKHTKFGYEEFK